jgi:2-C-methyl-D-erythritol 4-phosphate cytidylyltransferase
VNDVDAIVLAAGRGQRLGLGAKAWLVLDGRTLLERAVATARHVASHVTVGVAAEDLERARAACGEHATVVLGGATHRQTMIAAFKTGRAPMVLIHDVAHPFVTPALARQVIDTARARGAAVAVVPSMSSGFLERPGAPRQRLAARDIRLVRRPFACHRADFERVLDTIDSDDALTAVLEKVGVYTELVPAPSWNIKITTQDDWAVAQAMAEGRRLESGGPLSRS